MAVIGNIIAALLLAALIWLAVAQRGQGDPDDEGQNDRHDRNQGR